MRFPLGLGERCEIYFWFRGRMWDFLWFRGRMWDFLLVLSEGCKISFWFLGKDVRFPFGFGGRT